jgi:hypothetical protein
MRDIEQQKIPDGNQWLAALTDRISTGLPTNFVSKYCLFGEHVPCYGFYGCNKHRWSTNPRKHMSYCLIKDQAKVTHKIRGQACGQALRIRDKVLTQKEIFLLLKIRRATLFPRISSHQSTEIPFGRCTDAPQVYSDPMAARRERSLRLSPLVFTKSVPPKSHH